MANRRRRLSWYLIWFTALFFLLGAAFSIFISLPVWRIKSIVVIGQGIVSEQYLRKPAEKLIGENLFLADYSAIKAHIKGIHQITDFGIFRKLPSTVLIKVIERKPFAVAIVSGVSFVIDEEGYYLKAEGARSSKAAYDFVRIDDISGLPVVRGIKANREYSYRLDPDIALALSDSIKRLSKFLPPASLQIEMKESGETDLLVDDILRVRFGDTENIAKKIMVLEALLPEVAGKWQNVSYIDIRVANDPVIRFKKS
jgi:cell division septal protein FtsQ